MNIINKKRIRYYYVAGVLIAFFGLFVSFKFTLSTGNLPWFEPRLCIDGPYYINGMISIARSNDFLNLKDIYHSPGYQIYLALIYKFFPYDGKIFYIVKIVSWVLNLLCAGLVFYLGEKYFSQYVGIIATILFVWSTKYRIYINLLQPEVLLGFLLLMYVCFQMKAAEVKSKRKQLFLLFISGTLSSVICLIQVRYIFIVLFGCVSIYLKHRARVMNKKLVYKNTLFQIFIFFLPFILIFVAWSVYYSFKNHCIITGQSRSLWRFMIGNNPNALGYSYPYPVMGKPAGFQFIISQPIRFLWLIKQRFLFLWDFKKDIWYLKSPIIEWLNMHSGKGIFEMPFYLVCFFAFLAGFLIKIRSDLNRSSIAITSSLYLTFFASIIGPLLIFSSSRFLIPSVPLIVLFQSYFIIWFFQKLKNITIPLKAG